MTIEELIVKVQEQVGDVSAHNIERIVLLTVAALNNDNDGMTPDIDDDDDDDDGDGDDDDDENGDGEDDDDLWSPVSDPISG
jgi:hypothetical protein